MSKHASHDKHKGAKSEFIAISWLLSLGYEVFKNVSFHGDVDVIAWKDGVLECFDIKTINRTTVNYSLLPSQMNRNIKVIGVNLDNNFCKIIEPSLKFAEGICEECNKLFKKRKYDQKYCTFTCSNLINNRKAKIKQSLKIQSNA